MVKLNKLIRKIDSINLFFRGEINLEDLNRSLRNKQNFILVEEFCHENEISYEGFISLIKSEKRKFLGRRKSVKALSVLGISSILSACGVKQQINLDNLVNSESYILNLFYDLNKFEELKAVREPIYTSDENITIILVEDVHCGENDLNIVEKFFLDDFSDQRWTVELKQLEILRNKFKLNFVGIEGISSSSIREILIYDNIYQNNLKNKSGLEVKVDLNETGEEIVLEDGVVIKKPFVQINGEKKLVEYLVKDRNFNLVGLEDNYLQSISLGLYLFGFLLRLIEFKKSDSFKEIKKKIYDINLENQYFEASLFNRIFRTEKVLNFQFEAAFKLYWREKFTHENILDFYMYMVRHFDNPFNQRYRDQFIIDRRSQYGAKKMLDEMNSQNKKIGVIVFGMGHTQSLIDELQRLTNKKINIYVAK